MKIVYCLFSRLFIVYFEDLLNQVAYCLFWRLFIVYFQDCLSFILKICLLFFILKIVNCLFWRLFIVYSEACLLIILKIVYCLFWRSAQPGCVRTRKNQEISCFWEKEKIATIESFLNSSKIEWACWYYIYVSEQGKNKIWRIAGANGTNDWRKWGIIIFESNKQYSDALRNIATSQDITHFTILNSLAIITR